MVDICIPNPVWLPHAVGRLTIAEPVVREALAQSSMPVSPEARVFRDLKRIGWQGLLTVLLIDNSL